jgi:hypothetical protein
MARINKPKMELHMKETPDGLVPTEFTIEGISVPCKEIHIHLTANDPGEIVVHLSMYRVSLVLEKAE